MGSFSFCTNWKAQQIGVAKLNPTSVSAEDTKNGKSVLIVDQSEDNLEVLSTALRRRGMQTFVTSEARTGLQIAQEHHPEVIVLDLESEDADDDLIRSQYDQEAQQQNTSLVVLGTLRQGTSQSPHHELVSKPYHYAPLIRTIEQLALGRN